MQTSVSKHSIACSQRTFNETLARGHRPNTASIRRRGEIRACNRSGRRLVVFKGSTAKRAPKNQVTVTSRAAVKPRKAESENELPIRGDIVFSATATNNKPPEKRGRSLSSARDKRMPSGTRRPRSRSAARSNKSYLEPSGVVGDQPESSAVENVPLAKRGSVVDSVSSSAKNPTADYLISVDNPAASSIKTEESKLISSPTSVSSASNDDDNLCDESNSKKQSLNVTLRVPVSPAIVGYRKIVYDESHDGWIEHWKIEEDWKKARQRQKREMSRAKMARELANVITAPVCKVKGRSTARLQVMFPTAIVRGDRKRGFTHNITLTDPLRIELHKRKAPIVPTYYQRHIMQYGKLPFRNNPRPHPVV